MYGLYASKYGNNVIMVYTNTMQILHASPVSTNNQVCILICYIFHIKINELNIFICIRVLREILIPDYLQNCHIILSRRVFILCHCLREYCTLQVILYQCHLGATCAITMVGDSLNSVWKLLLSGKLFMDMNESN